MSCASGVLTKPRLAARKVSISFAVERSAPAPASAWERVIPFFAFPLEVRKVVYTTNAVESLHMSLRKIIKTRGSFPSEEAALKLLYLALRKVVAKWETVQHWKQMLNYLDTVCGDRIQEAGIRR
jgi:putative transposase